MANKQDQGKEKNKDKKGHDEEDKDKKDHDKEDKDKDKNKKDHDKEDKDKNKDKKDHDKENKGNKQENKPQPESGGAGDVVTDFIEDVWKVMTPEMLERLRCVLTEDMGMSKKDADKFLQDQREVRRQRICLPKEQRTVRIGIRNQWIKELSRDVANQMASFLVGILLSNRTARTKKITEKILERLCQITGEKTTLKSAKTRMHRMLVVIADRMATYFDEAITDIEKEMMSKACPCLSALPRRDWERESVSTVASTETYTPSELDEYDLDKMSESELERLLANEKKKQVSIIVEGEIITEEEGTVSGRSDEEGSEPKEESEGVESDEPKSEASAVEEEEEEGHEEIVEEEEEKEEEEPEEEEDVEEEEAKVEEEEAGDEDVDEEEVEEEEVEEEEEEEGEEGEEGETEEEKPKEKKDSPKKPEEVEDKKPSRNHLDILELLKEDIERTPMGDRETDRQMAVKEIIEKRFKEVAKDILHRSMDSIVRIDIDETANVVANWLEKILPSGDIAAKLSFVPSLIEKQGSAFEITAEGSEYQIQKISSTTAAQKVAETKGVDFPVRKKKLPRTMSPINANTTKDWADWALEAVNVGEEWGKWLDKALDSVEQHLVEGKGTEEAKKERHDGWKNWKDELEHEAQKLRAENHKIKGEGYLWNKKMGTDTKKSVGEEKDTKV